MRIELVAVEPDDRVGESVGCGELRFHSTQALAADVRGPNRTTWQTVARELLRNLHEENLYLDVPTTNLLYWHGQAIVDDAARAS
jgi:hypothetical protein